MTNNKETNILVKGYEGNDRLRAGLIYEMLMDKQKNREHIDMGTPERKVEVMIKEVTKMEKEDFIKREMVYKVEFKAVVL